MFSNFIQIAGVIDKEESDLLINCGVRYLGFPLRLPVNKEDLTDEEAKKIISQLPPSAKGILITYLNKADEISKLSKKIGVKIIQLHGDIQTKELLRLKKIDSDYIIIKSLIIGKTTTEDIFNTLRKFGNYVDAFITDTYNPKTGATGATGIIHDWSISKRIVESTNKPVILAGGLTAENVFEAILTVKPTGVDTHTGVENDYGRKSKDKISAFIKNAKEAFSQIKKSKK